MTALIDRIREASEAIRPLVLVSPLEAGEIFSTPEYPTVSDGSADLIETGSVTFPVCQPVIDERVKVSKREIAQATRRVVQSGQWMIERAVAVLGGLVKTADRWADGKGAVVLCGRNVTIDTYLGARELGRD